MHLDSLVLSVLAVAGGAAAGAAGAGMSTRLAGRYFATRVPRPALLLSRLLGGGAAGLAVWLWVFGTGGNGWGPGGGGALFGGKGAGDEGKSEQISTTGREPLVRSTAPANSDTLRVIMLGGERVKDGRFYQVEGESKPKTFAELKEDIKAKQRAGRLRTIEIVIYEDSVARNHPSVRELSDWASENSIPTIIPDSREGNAP